MKTVEIGRKIQLTDDSSLLMSMRSESENLFETQPGKVLFPIVFHAHQPVDNFGWVFEDAYDRAYDPLLRAVERHSSVKVGLHFSGPLLEWLDSERPQYISRVSALVRRNQVELLGGAFYEAILASIPDEDKELQLGLMNDFLKDRFGVRPRGAWLAERAWEPSLPGPLSSAGLDYILVDDYHVKSCGYSDMETAYSFTTEDQGRIIRILPINEQIRYLTPWKAPKATFEYMLQFAQTPKMTRIVTSIDDAEKMGVWPAGDRTTYDICYETGYDGFPWIDKWLAFVQNLPWVESVLPSDAMDRTPSKGPVYLPSTSYDKMGVWVLPTKARARCELLLREARDGRVFTREPSGELENRSDWVKEFVKGGFWRQFMTKYPESSWLHKRMLFARERVQEAARRQGMTPDVQKAQREILRAQCNDVYWHGMFAGLAYVFLRHAAYRRILMGESAALRILKRFRNDLGETVCHDIDLDGMLEIIMENSDVFAVVSPHDGGTLRELDFKPAFYNFQNVLTRRREAYHTLAADVVEDRWIKASFRDHLVGADVTPENLLGDSFEETGQLADLYYRLVDQTMDSIRLTGKTAVEGHPIAVDKEYSLHPGKRQLSVSYAFDRRLPVTFSPELALMLSGDPKSIRLLVNGETASSWRTYHGEARSLVWEDPTWNARIGMNLDELKQIVVGPIELKVKSDLGWESQYQGLSIFVQEDISSCSELSISLSVDHICSPQST